jgi:glutamine synthetase
MPDSKSVVVDDIRALMISHIDNAGISRVKIAPQHRVRSALTKGSTISLSVGMLLAIDDHATSTPSIDPTIGDLRGIPDEAALAWIDRERGLAWAPSDLYGLDGAPHPTCQRSALKRIVRDAGFDFLVGMELEFTLFRGTKDDPEVAHLGPGYGTLPFFELESWHLDLLDALQVAGVPVEQLHPEYEDGQVELSLAPRDPVRAVDDYVLARMIVTRVALQHGLLVSFAPVAVFGGVSNGCHIHLSAVSGDGGSNIFYDPERDSGMTIEAEHMIGGIVSNLVDGLVLLGGSTLSFERLKPHNWAGGGRALHGWIRRLRRRAVEHRGEVRRPGGEPLPGRGRVDRGRRARGAHAGAAASGGADGPRGALRGGSRALRGGALPRRSRRSARTVRRQRLLPRAARAGAVRLLPVGEGARLGGERAARR